MATGIVMPKAGNSVEECILGAWRVKVGDVIKKGDIIVEAETDKTSIEVEATADGTVLALFGEEGDLIPVLHNICAVGNPGEDFATLAPASASDNAAPAAETKESPAAEEKKPEAAKTAATPVAANSAANNAPMSPRAKKFVEEHPFVIPAITGTGAQGRIMEADVKAAYQTAPHLSSAAAAMIADGAAIPEAGTGENGLITADDVKNGTKATPAAAPIAAATPAAAAADEDIITEKPLSHIRKIIAGRLHDSLAGMAQYTLNTEADVSGLLALRKKIKAAREKNIEVANANIGDMIMYSVIKALEKHPELNGHFEKDVIKLHSALNVGFACDTPKGLMVPVVHHCEKISLGDMSNKVKAMAKDANSGKLAPDYLTGCTFTVSNLGAMGVTTFTPVVNSPELAILGVGKTLLRPVRTKTGEIVYKDYMQFSLTLNHMIIDGAPGARFLQTFVNIVENFELICIAG
ncbi:MAG: dihydrolipoamide acetyltransferase family protein [Lentisphaeria bacterium]